MIWIRLALESAWRHACWAAGSLTGTVGVILAVDVRHSKEWQDLLFMCGAAMAVWMGSMLDTCRAMFAQWPEPELEEPVIYHG